MSVPNDGEPIQLNGAFHVDSSIVKFIIASVVKAEPGAFFHNCQKGIVFCSILEDMGHPQPKTPVHCDNATAVGITDSTITRRRSRSMEMRLFWISSKVAQDTTTDLTIVALFTSCNLRVSLGLAKG